MIKHTVNIVLLTLIFLTQFGCNKSCKGKLNCELVPDSGICEAGIPKYYFDIKEGMCKEFSWGGCGGTVPFETLKECEKCKCHK